MKPGSSLFYFFKSSTSVFLWLVVKIKLYLHSTNLFFPKGEPVKSREVCCLWYLLHLKWFFGRQLEFPHVSFPSDFFFFNGVRNSRAWREHQLHRATMLCCFTAFMTNSICIFKDKSYSAGNFALAINHPGCGLSQRDLMIYIAAGWLLINSPLNDLHLDGLSGCLGHILSLYIIRCGRLLCTFVVQGNTFPSALHTN